MNIVLHYLTQNWTRLDLDKDAGQPELACTVLTPRFRTSSHLIFFVHKRGTSAPAFVAKVPRLPGDHERLAQEAALLQRIHTYRADGFGSIPRLIAFEACGPYRLLIETAVAGVPMRPALVRKNFDGCLEAGVSWLIDFHRATAHEPSAGDAWLHEQIQAPLQTLEQMLPQAKAGMDVPGESHHLLDALRQEGLPAVVSHGDLSHPNIMLAGEFGLRVVDWELAAEDGLPALDLFFFLTYLAFARANAQKTGGHEAAFHRAFFGREAWAGPSIRRYCAALQISPRAAVSLFVLCWAKYVADLVRRLERRQEPDRRLSEETARWLQQNRYYRLWSHALAHVQEFKIFA